MATSTVGAGGPRAAGWLLLLVLPLAAGPAGEAETATVGVLEFEVDEAEGVEARAVRAAAVEVVYSPGEVPDVRIVADRVSGTLYESTVRYRVVAGQRVGEAPRETVEHLVSDSTFASRSLRPDSRLLASLECGGANECGSAAGAAQLQEALGHLEGTAHVLQLFPDVRPLEGRVAYRDPNRQFFTDEPRIQAPGSNLSHYGGLVRLYAWEMEWRFQGRDGASRSFAAGVEVEQEAGPSATIVERVLLFKGSAENMSIAGNRLHQWWRLGDLDVGAGAMTLRNATGVLHAAGAARPVTNAVVRLEHGPGRFHAKASDDWGRRSYSVRLDADVRAVSVDGRPIVWDRAASPSPAVALGVGVGAASLVGLAVLFSRRTRATDWPGYQARTLRNDRRRLLYRWIQEAPGVQPFHLWHRLGGAFGTTLRSLERLERVGLVRSTRVGGFRHYFDASVSQATATALAPLATRTLRETLRALADLAPCDERTLRARLRVSHATLQPRLRRLLDLGAIERAREKGRFAYRVVASTPRPGGPVPVVREAPGTAAVAAT
ncbi:MAG: hypothetical protein HYT80_08105 [Euryarchaeota archaeon]|nr:hypothetical protein [Euryarchaeota archaeon]